MNFYVPAFVYGVSVGFGCSLFIGFASWGISALSRLFIKTMGGG